MVNNNINKHVSQTVENLFFTRGPTFGALNQTKFFGFFLNNCSYN